VDRVSAIGRSQTVGDLVNAVADVLRSDVDLKVDLKVGVAAEARELVAAYFDQPRYFPIINNNKWVESADWQRVMDAAAMRASGAPLAYAVGRASFRALTLRVDERVLIPRPETELLVDLVLRRQRTGVVVDVGTGSGAIAIALATEGSFDRVVATDISTDALAVARENALSCSATVEFIHADLLGFGLWALDAGVTPNAHSPKPTVVVSNPPYIALGESVQLPQSVRDWEPAMALYSGHDGMSATARLVRQAGGALGAGGLLALEVDSRRASLAAELLASDGRYEHITVELDLTGRERFVLATRRRGEGES
jgi:release factor glutamine methyltransferase